MDQAAKTPPGGTPAGDLLDASSRLAQKSCELMLAGMGVPGFPAMDGGLDPLGLRKAVGELGARLCLNPALLAGAHASLWWDFMALYAHAAARITGVPSEPLIEPERDDRRFRDAAWDENAAFDVIKQGYLLTSRAWLALLTDVQALDPRARRSLEFVARQTLDACSPTNFAATNPEVLRETLNSGGKNLIEGLGNLIDDLDVARGRLDVRMADPDAFVVGRDLAVTPGKVVYQNELMQLIQYAPATDTVYQRPLLLVPPWMNKFYVLDLRPGNSLVEWLLAQGHTLFVVSWVNPDASLGHKGFEDYMLEGPLAALDAIERATGEREVNVAGYCLGGILLSAMAAWLGAIGDTRLNAATYLTTMVDFSDVGDIAPFIDADGLPALEADIRERGYLPGKAVGDTWRALRANDLVWSFFVNNYLLGNSPRPFDILYWNCDATNMPAAMHTFFMRNMYVENRLREPGGITLAGEPIDVTRITTPAYVLSTREDHIAPWKTTYQTTQLFAGPVKFVLGASGHIAGVVNPPDKRKYGYWSNAQTPPSADEWLEGARRHRGSWWPDWGRWLKRHAGARVAARIPGAGALEPIEDAPGSYVLRKLP